MYTIRFCHGDEYLLLQNFIKDSWREDHVFVKEKSILDWQYYNKEQGNYNFVVAYNEMTCEFDAILGFIPTSHFDKELIVNSEIWLAIWRLKDSAKESLSGMNLLHFLRNKLKPTSIYAIGISDVVKKIYQVLGYDVNKLDHFYVVNKSLLKYQLIHVGDEKDEIKLNNSLFHLHEVDLAEYRVRIGELCQNTIDSPKKSYEYYKQRYLNHKWFKYRFLGLFDEDVLVGLIVFRKLQVGSAKCLRIMDWIGDFVESNIQAEIQNFLLDEDAEYIDFVCHVPNKVDILRMGFQEKNNLDVIPEYFDPFVPENADIYYCAKTKNAYRLVKGDSDQDRPNSCL